MGTNRGTNALPHDANFNQFYTQVLVKPLSGRMDSILRRLGVDHHLDWLSESRLILSATHILGLLVWSVLCVLALSATPAVLGLASPLFCITGCFYWFSLLTRKTVSSSSLYLILWFTLFGELMDKFRLNSSIYSSSDPEPGAGSETLPAVASSLTSWMTFIVCGLLLMVPISVFWEIRPKLVCKIIALSLMVRILSLSSSTLVGTCLRPYLALVCGFLGVTLARFTESLLCPPISALITPDGRIVAWKRRRSSNTVFNPTPKPRRTSLPSLGGNRSQSFHGNHASSSSIDSALLVEAHGLITDMLNDNTLPPHIISGLRAVASLLAPPNTPTARSKPIGPASVALADFNSGSDSEEMPYTGERPSALPKRGRRNLPPSLMRRMSTSTWSTTTSATGMPMLEPEPSRKRCTSFRNVSGLHSPNSPIAAAFSPMSNPCFQKGRSYSTTALPAGTLAQLQEKRERKTICSFHPFDSNLVLLQSRRREAEEGEADTEATAEEDVLSSVAQLSIGGQTQAKQFAPRLNLTSDYDSSNDSPSGSDATGEDSIVAPETGPKSVFTKKLSAISTMKVEKSPTNLGLGIVAEAGQEEEEAVEVWEGWEAREGREGLQKCSICGSKTLRKVLPKERSSEAIWPNAPPPPPLPANIDSLGRYIVKGMVFDVDEMAIDPLLSEINDWDYPIFELNDHAGDAILSQICYRIFLEAGLIEAFRIPLPEFLHFFRALEKGYKDKPYHNRMHAADVLHGVYYLTSQPIPGFAQIPPDSDESPLQKTSIGPLPQSYVRHISVCEDTYGILGANFPALELMALYTAAAMHDYDHPGRTNAFLVSTFAPQAVLYNDRSVLENHHAAAAWSLFLSQPHFNWLRHLDKAEFKRFRFLVIEFILATDLKRHFEILAEFNAKMNEDEAPGLDWFSETDRLLAMQMCIKLSDINGPCKRHDIHVQWTYRIAEEFYEQGDEEARLGLPISPFMDRRHPQLAKLQESFINHLVAPLCNAYAEAGLLPGLWEYQDLGSSGDLSGHLQVTDQKEAKEGLCSSLGPCLEGSSQAKKTLRKVICLQTKHLQENYEVWIKILKEEKASQQQNMSSSPTSSSDDSSTPVFNQQPLEEIVEAEESQTSSEGSSCGSSQSQQLQAD